MRLSITHETTYSYETPASYAIQTLRLTPRNSAQQFVQEWRIDVSQDCRLSPVEDPFGNLTHSFSIDGPIEELVITATGEVLTEYSEGIVRGTKERFPLSLFLRDTELTRPDPDIREFARSISCGEGGDPLATLHALMRRIHAEWTYDKEATDPSTSAAKVFEQRHGVCQDFAHLFIAAARALDIPARYVGGYVFEPGTTETHEAGHAWVEGFVAGIGWIGFDPTHEVCPTDRHVRIASGLDYLDAAPIRGTRYGGTGESMKVKVAITRLDRP